MSQHDGLGKQTSETSRRCDGARPQQRISAALRRHCAWTHMFPSKHILVRGRGQNLRRIDRRALFGADHGPLAGMRLSALKTYLLQDRIAHSSNSEAAGALSEKLLSRLRHPRLTFQKDSTQPTTNPRPQNFGFAGEHLAPSIAMRASLSVDREFPTVSKHPSFQSMCRLWSSGRNFLRRCAR